MLCRHAPPTLCKAVAFSERKRETSSAEADTLHASTMCSETVLTAAVLKGTRSFLTDITAHRLRLPCRRDAPTSCQIKIIRRDHPTNASQYQGHAASCLWCKGDRLAKRCAAVGSSRLRDVGTFPSRPFNGPSIPQLPTIRPCTRRRRALSQLTPRAARAAQQVGCHQEPATGTVR